MPSIYRVLAAGLNAHGQLSGAHLDDLFTLNSIYHRTGRGLRLLFAGWSASVFLSDNELRSLGYRRFAQAVEDTDAVFSSGFGNHDGLIGCLHGEGHLWLAEEQACGNRHLVDQARSDSPALGHIAQAGNDRIAITLMQSNNSCNVLEFHSMDAFQRWYCDPSAAENIVERHELPGRPVQLLGNTATFVLLMADGNVYTWGDSRHRSLARPVSGDDATAADTPGFVEALGGLSIVKIAAGGWMSAALSADGAMYFWGVTTPGQSDESIRCLQDAGAGNAALVELLGADAEPMDVLDMAIGDNHAVVLTQHNRIFAVGENRNGQLGIGSDSAFLGDWQEVPHVGKATAVYCGPKSTFVIVHEGESPLASHASVHHPQEAKHQVH